MIKYSFSDPSFEEYNELRSAVGWEAVSRGQFENAIDHSVSVCARDGAKLVGYARNITDKGMMSFIVDVMVAPGVQSQGIGTALMKSLMDDHRSWLKEGEIGYISVLATTGKEPFYKKLGFAKRPNIMLGAGMTAKVRPLRKK